MIKTLSSNLDVTYTISAPAGGGLVSPRDFVNIRGHGFEFAPSPSVAPPKPGRRTTPPAAKPPLSAPRTSLSPAGPGGDAPASHVAAPDAAAAAAPVSRDAKDGKLAKDAPKSATRDPAAKSSNDGGGKGQLRSMWIAGYGIETHKRAPVRSSYVRGLNGPGGYVVTPVLSHPKRADACWILNADVRGWIPRSFLDSGHASVLATWARQLRAAARS